MVPISKLASGVQLSPTLAAGARARQMRAQGIRVFDFCLGEPDFHTPAHICQAAIRAMEAGHTHYTAAEGLIELRRAVANRYRRLHGLDCEGENVLISNGAKHALHNALTAVCNPGDEVVIPTPHWVSYSDLVLMSGARPVLVRTTPDNGFKMTASAFRAELTRRTRVLLINSPCNPTGTVYTRDELRSLAEVAVDADLVVLSDEIYEQLVYDGARGTCFSTLLPGLADRTVVVSGASKTYAMTGWRMGWAVGPASVIRAMANVQSQQTSSPSTISQYAALEAITGDQTCTEVMHREFEDRRKLVCQKLQRMPGISVPKVPDGAFYVFFEVRGLFGRRLGGRLVTDSVTFCEAALETAHVNMVPGVAFGEDGFVRLSFAASRQDLTEGLQRLEELVQSQNSSS